MAWNPSNSITSMTLDKERHLWALGIKILSGLHSLVRKIKQDKTPSIGPGRVNINKRSLFSGKHRTPRHSSSSSFQDTVSDENLGMYIGIPRCQLVRYFRHICRLTISPEHYAKCFLIYAYLPACLPACLWILASFILRVLDF